MEKPGRTEQVFREALREPLLSMKAAEDLAHGCNVEQGQLKELACAREDSIGNKRVQVRMKIGSEGGEGLDRDDSARTDVGARYYFALR